MRVHSPREGQLQRRGDAHPAYVVAQRCLRLRNQVLVLVDHEGVAHRSIDQQPDRVQRTEVGRRKDERVEVGRVGVREHAHLVGEHQRLQLLHGVDRWLEFGQRQDRVEAAAVRIRQNQRRQQPDGVDVAYQVRAASKVVGR